MAFWGMKLTETDEFCQVYDLYMDLYDTGMEPSAITAHLLDAQTGEIPDCVYLAIAKAEWVLCAQSEEILNQVRCIIDSGVNIEYYRSLGFSETELMQRQAHLQKFWIDLRTPKAKARKRRISSYNQIKHLPKGTVAWYEADGGYYGFVVLDAVYDGRLLVITKRLSVPPATQAEVLDAAGLTAIWMALPVTPKGSHPVGRIEITDSYNGRAGMLFCKAMGFGVNYSFYLDECHLRGLCDLGGVPLRELLEAERLPIRFYNEDSAEQMVRMVKELAENPASAFAGQIIRDALSCRYLYE